MADEKKHAHDLIRSKWEKLSNELRQVENKIDILMEKSQKLKNELDLLEKEDLTIEESIRKMTLETKDLKKKYTIDPEKYSSDYVKVLEDLLKAREGLEKNEVREIEIENEYWEILAQRADQQKLLLELMREFLVQNYDQLELMSGESFASISNSSIASTLTASSSSSSAGSGSTMSSTVDSNTTGASTPPLTSSSSIWKYSAVRIATR